jgi:hypothetical protein
MNKQNKTAERDDVLFAFHNECERPTAAEIAKWVELYPQFGDDIREHAAIRNEWDDSACEESDVDESTLARGRSNALNLLHQVRQGRPQQQAVDDNESENWSQLVSRAGFDIPRLARTINIDRMVLAELNAGRIRMPIGKKLRDALSDVLNVSMERLILAISRLLNQPMRLGHAKADGPPIIRTRTYEEVIRASPMAPEEQSHWLSEK